MLILTVNIGSSSVRLGAFVRDNLGLTEHASTRHELGAGNPGTVLKKFLRKYGGAHVDVSVHRIVHGGPDFTKSCLLGPKAEQEIAALAPLAPLHNPAALEWVVAAREAFGKDLAQVAVFDTAFFTALTETAHTYAIPYSLAEKHRLRRYGFHGLAHQAMWQSWRSLQSAAMTGGKIISLQLGSGCSITATDDGSPRDTSMGFSPLEGLMMGTRSGDIDPGLVTYLQRQEKLTPGELDTLLNEQSGLLGVSGVSANIGDLLRTDCRRARLALNLYCYRARKYVGAYLAVLGGATAIVFGGGVGENVPAVRENILRNMGWCGIELDLEKNTKPCDRAGATRISSHNSRVEVWVIPVNEAALLAREGEAVMTTVQGGKQYE
jgi:acetate kinase